MAMDAYTRNEIEGYIRTLALIIGELDDMAVSLNRDFRGIGAELCAQSITSVANQYRFVKRRLQNINPGSVTDEFAAAHPSDSN